MKKLKFFNLQDLLISVIPGFLTILTTIKDFEFWIALILGIVVLLLFIVLIIRKNIGVYKKEIADILANGYYINFLENLSYNLYEFENEIEFGDKKTEFYDLDKISIEIIVPRSNEKLCEVADKLNDSKKLESINLKNRKNNSGFWARAERTGDSIIIKDFPRTLFSLPKYLKNELGEEYDEKKSMKYHKIFTDKIEKLISENSQNRVLAKFKIVEE
ncbi:hypothetical protein D1164_10680 [Mariniphaga sediminis]|jgi:hypothetical protein|uniref:Prokaryotic STING domain-containing protein n=1 Tax=Mariniphaga sediminis TaxID=1628158 RepID=A0A399D0T9_9BACT|nr:STING domain-containing protein [Mariniphaga sediminis]RIH65046.1 hypothetical protein D1164_10680 [Mariniphaga sediminis]